MKLTIDRTLIFVHMNPRDYLIKSGVIIKCITIVFSLCFSCFCKAQGQDSLLFMTMADSIVPKSEKIFHGRLFQSTYIGVPLIALGVAEIHNGYKFRHLRNDFIPSFSNKLDNYTQVAPMAVLYGMKVCNVESKSSWGKMILADAISAGLMAATVNSIKYTTQIERPDGTTKNSFPSGHTATAFMSATMLTNEYGDKSPWIGMAAYTFATATGFFRIANNRHWMSDVLAGAGIGIMSVEFGYWLTDLIMHKTPSTFSTSSWEICDNDNPSFIGLTAGYNIPLSEYDLSEEIEMETSTGTTIGIEGAYFFNRHTGIGGKVSASNVRYISKEDESGVYTFCFYSADAGAYFNLPLTRRFSLGTKAIMGWTFYPELKTQYLSIPASSDFSCGTGLSVDFRAKENFSVKLTLDYSLLPPHSDFSGEYMHILTLGGTAAIRF